MVFDINAISKLVKSSAVVPKYTIARTLITVLRGPGSTSNPAMHDTQGYDRCEVSEELSDTKLDAEHSD